MVQQSSATAAKPRGPASLLGPNGERPRLLLAEDSEPVRVLTAAMLKVMGCTVMAVVHGEQAVREASEHHFDLIVLDIEMPVMDGITAARSIRSLGGPAAATPLMALSAFLADSVRGGQWRETFDIALPKPANRNELREAVASALSRSPAGAAAAPVLPALADHRRLDQLRHGLTAAVWAELARAGCRDIEIAAHQLGLALAAGQSGAVLTFAGKLGALGRTYASPRLVFLAHRIRLASSEADRTAAIAALIGAAEEFLPALGG